MGESLPGLGKLSKHPVRCSVQSRGYDTILLGRRLNYRRHVELSRKSLNQSGRCDPCQLIMYTSRYFWHASPVRAFCGQRSLTLRAVGIPYHFFSEACTSTLGCRLWTVIYSKLTWDASAAHVTVSRSRETSTRAPTSVEEQEF